MLVVDASVVVKMFIPERGGEAAPSLLERPETLLVPAHCLRKLVRCYRASTGPA